MKRISLLLVFFLILCFSIQAQEKIFYVAKSSTDYYTIFSVNPDGSEKVQIFDDNWHRSGVNVTSDGELYYLKREYFNTTLGGQTILCKSNLDGSNETDLWTYPDGNNHFLRGYIDLRSDKQRILYSTFQESERNGDVFELDLVSNTVTNISNNYDYPPSGSAKYSEDLSKILFVEMGSDWYAYPWYMFLINADGTNRTKLTPDVNESYYCSAFSNDGTKIIYCSYTGLTTPLSLFIANSDGTNGQQIIPSSGSSDGIWYPTFSPDDSKIVFYRNGNLVVSHPDGTIINEFASEAVQDQSNIVWADIKNYTIYFEDQTAKAGNVIEVPVLTSELSSSNNIISYQFDFNYNNTQLEYIGHSLVGTLAEGGAIQVNPGTNKLSIAWADDEAIIGEGEILKLHFKILDVGSITPTITNALYNTTPATSIANGTITSTYFYGDVDANEYVQAYDAALTIQYCVGLDPLPIVDPLPWENWRIVIANVDGTGDVTAYDASLILQYVVGLIATFPAESKSVLNENVADVTVEFENGYLKFYASGELFGFDLNVLDDTNNACGIPEILDQSYMMAYNNNNEYKVAVCSAYPVFTEQAFMQIPITGSDISNLRLEMIMNTTPKTIGGITFVEKMTNSKISIHPNPVKDILNFKNLKGSAKISIFDLSGHQVLNTDIQTNQINLSKLHSGFYTIKISQGNEIYIFKFLKH